MTSSDIDFIRAILSVTETGKEQWDPSEVFVYKDDNRFSPPRRQITLSIGFTEGGGNLRKVLERYIERRGNLSSEFASFQINSIGDKARGSLAGNEKFKSLLKDAGKETLMVEVQKECFDEMYLTPAFAWAETYGFKQNLSHLVIADSFLHSGSMLGFLMAKFSERKPKDGGNEKKWITDYLNARHSWLKNHSNTILNKTTYRADAYLRSIAKEDWALTGPVMMQNKAIIRIA
jgi:chitosanase